MIHIIAEAGTNHNGKLEKAFHLVDIAKASGANSVKFQIIYPDGLYLPSYYSRNGYQKNEAYEVRKENMLQDDDYLALAEYCRKNSIDLSASVFDEKGLALIKSLQASYIKIASCDLNNTRLILRAAETGKKMIISTGMATLSEIEYTVTELFKANFRDIVLMHCVSIYPSKLEQTNLSFIKTLKTAFGFPVGFSDHTEDSIASAIAVSLGAEWIEKHFTYNRKAKGFDHAYALEAEQFKDFVHNVRMAETACTHSIVKTQLAETEVKKRARRGLYAKRDIKKGEIIQEKDILVVRPEAGLNPNDISIIIGLTVRKNINKYEALNIGMFNND